MWGLWWTKRHWGRCSPSTSVSPANHSTVFSIIIITQGWHNRPLSGRSVEWTLIPPPLCKLKKIVTGYGLDDRGVGVPVPVGARIFSSPRRPHHHWGPPSLLYNGYRGLFPLGEKRPRREAHRSLPTSAEIKKTWIYTSTPPKAFMA
jgi:hypothetical protein